MKISSTIGFTVRLFGASIGPYWHIQVLGIERWTGDGNWSRSLFEVDYDGTIDVLFARIRESQVGPF